MSAAGAVGWQVLLGSVPSELGQPVALAASGPVPAELHGTLYLLGPGRREVHGSPDASLLDGDGMVHAVTISPRGVEYRRRFVETYKKRSEDEAGRRLHPTVGARPPGGFLDRLRHARPSSVANGGVVVHAGRVLALWDGAPPYAIDPATLETTGLDLLGGALRRADGFGTNPRHDPVTGELWNVGMRAAPRPRVAVYRWPMEGRAELVVSGRVPYRTIARDFALTATKAVVVVSPVVLGRVADLALGRTCIAEALSWRPELGSHIGIVDRTRRRGAWHAAPPMFVSSVAQAFDDGEDVVVDVCTYPDAGVLEAATGMLAGSRRGAAYTTLERLRVPPIGPVERTLLPPLDHPRLSDPGFAGPAARIFGLNLNPRAGFLGTPVAVDTGTGAVDWVPPLVNELAGPPVPVPKAGATDGAVAWLLTVVTDTMTGRTELRALDGEDLGVAPRLRIALPDVVPFGTRGVWSPTGS